MKKFILLFMLANLVFSCHGTGSNIQPDLDNALTSQGAEYRRNQMLRRLVDNGTIASPNVDQIEADFAASTGRSIEQYRADIEHRRRLDEQLRNSVAELNARSRATLNALPSEERMAELLAERIRENQENEQRARAYAESVRTNQAHADPSGNGSNTPPQNPPAASTAPEKSLLKNPIFIAVSATLGITLTILVIDWIINGKKSIVGKIIYGNSKEELPAPQEEFSAARSQAEDEAVIEQA